MKPSFKSPYEPSVGFASDAEQQVTSDQAPFNAIKASEQISISQVKALILAAEYSSFSKAASALQISQPSLSRHIKEIERAFGKKLFTRTSNGVALTDAGTAFMPQAKSLLEAYDEVVSLVVKRKIDQIQTLNVAASHSIGPVIHGLLTSKLKSMPRSVGLQLSVMSSEDVLTQVAEHRVEFGVCAEMGGHPDIRYTPVLEAQLGLIAPLGCDLPEHIMSLDDLGSVPLIRLADTAPITRLLTRERVHFPAYFNSSMRFSCLSSAMDLMRRQCIAAVGTGIGASLLPASDFRFVPLPNLLPKMIVHLVSARQLSDDVEREDMRDLVCASIHESPWHISVHRLNLLRA